MAGSKRKPTNPPPPEPDHTWHEPIKPDYKSIERRRELEAVQRRRDAYLANFRRNFNRYA